MGCSDLIKFKREFCVFNARGIEAAVPFSLTTGDLRSEAEEEKEEGGREDEEEEAQGGEEVRVKG